MRELRIGFVDTIEPIAEFFTAYLGFQFRIIRDDDNPKYLIFGDENFGQRNREEKYMKVPVRIFYTGENRRPWNYFCHYSISFDHDILDNRNYRLPLHVLANWHQVHEGMPNALEKRRTFKSYFPEKKFCSFVVKNGACKMRNDFFQKLSAYKSVDSAGPLFNNVTPLPQGEGGVKAKHQFLNQYKFNMCFENGSYPGYCTEKLFEALYADTIPIYWGSPTAALDFNSKAFLSWHDYMDDDLLLKRIRELDEDEDQYLDMLLQPMFPEGEVPAHWDVNGRFIYWWNKYVWQG
jgi:hypothetical protein